MTEPDDHVAMTLDAVIVAVTNDVPRVLVVDNEDDSRDCLMRWLTRLGCDAHGVDSGYEGVRTAADLQPALQDTVLGILLGEPFEDHLMIDDHAADSKNIAFGWHAGHGGRVYGFSPG